MKLIKLIIIFLFCILIFNSCNNKLKYLEEIKQSTINNFNQIFSYLESDDIPLNTNIIFGGDMLQFSNGYIFFNNSGNSNIFFFPENKTLCKYNLIKNNITTVCQDSICLHNNKECPFFAMDNTMYIYKDKILYTCMYILPIEQDISNDVEYEKWGGFMMYDMTKNKSYVRNEINPDSYSEYMKQLFVDDYSFYYDYVYNEELDEWAFSICRWDLINNEIKVITGENNIYDPDSEYPDALACTFIFTLDSRIYFSDGKTIYSTDINYENRIDHIKGSFIMDVYTDGEYIYYGVPVEKGSHIQSLHRVNFDGSNDIEVGIVTEQRKVEITSKYIYYNKYDRIEIGKNNIRGYVGDNIVLYNSEIWRCNHDGTNHELIYKFESDMANYRILHEVYVGNYIYALYNWWEDPNNDGIYEDGDHYSSATTDEYKIMRIDVTTGEIYIINGTF